MNFIDFSRFQVLPTGSLRFAWTLESKELPATGAIIRLFRDHRNLRSGSPPRGRRSQADASPPRGRRSQADASPYLCRREDFASNLLHTRLPKSMKSSANVKIRIRTKLPWQRAVACSNLFHNLADEETLLVHADLEKAPLGEHLSAHCGRKPPRPKDLAAQAHEFRLFLKKSVFQETVLLLDHLARKEDDRLLRYLLESGEISGLTAVLLGDSVPGECDLEFNENPPNLLARNFPSHNPEPPALDQSEDELLAQFALLGVAVPRAVASLLAGPGGEVLLASLLEKGLLLENRDQRTLAADGGGDPLAGDRPARNELLKRMAQNCDWPYARIAHFIASDQTAELEKYLRKQALESPDQIAPGPAADLLARHLGRFLPHAAPGNRILEYGLDILIQGNCQELAAKVIAGFSGRMPAQFRLKKAHLALRRKEYRELGRLLAGIKQAPADPRLLDEWLYLNFIFNEKSCQKSKAGEYAGRIKSPYYRNLSLVQLSDRSIYKRDFARARAQLAGALEFFSASGRLREAIEARSQIAKLLREEGDFKGAESMYKTIYVEGEAEGLALNAAAAAVDLGNLYLENDDDFQAECWYRKAGRAFAKEKNTDGLMLVNSNLVNVFVAKGEWLEADRLLDGILAWDDEKQLPDSFAIDLLNQAGIETLRLHDDKALDLVGRAEAIFRNSANHKGLGECAFLRTRIAGPAGEGAPSACSWFSQDQKIVCELLGHPGRPGDRNWDAGLLKAITRIRSRKVRFEALRLLLKKHRRSEWLERFKEMAWELSPKTKNYYFYEYWYWVFDLAAEEPPGQRRDEFLAMYDFFSGNRRAMPAKFARMHQQCAESERARGLFDDARLVERSRHWRLPADFFHSFLHEIAKPAPIDWLVMAVHETPPSPQKPADILFRFASPEMFNELGDEMLAGVLASPQNQNFDLQEVRGRFRSQEKFFYPFASTKVIRWPIAENYLACLVVAFKDGSLHFQDFADRHRETLKKFSLLFQNFLQNEYRNHEKLDAIVGESEKIRELKRMIAQVSKVDFSLLITGESGSGKELVANAVHRLSPRAGRPFISLNAAAIPDTLLEAELFGFRKGAFSGAGEDRVGLLEAANRGTLFLDEIADLPLPLQAKLLRALQEREIRRLGENRTIQVDVRLISASNKDLGELIRRNLFRADLFYRLQDLVIHIPPLREHREDIPLLIGSFLEKYGYPKQEAVKLSAIADLFRNDEFPGNVRELESRIKNLITFHPGLDAPPPAARTAFSLRNARRDFEKDLLRNILAEVNWRRSQAAAKLGISRMALFNLLKKYGISE
ncbi:MAG: sigma 54-interacting transcriptional regulator [Acidobacteriota bacterium]|nr:sigma 54-interacting transcriptional regulator [Acidobacteriota bacterium]